jgi:hypothetical protein
VNTPDWTATGFNGVSCVNRALGRYVKGRAALLVGTIRCPAAGCGLEEDVAVLNVPSVPAFAWQREVERVALADLARCRFGSPGNCLDFQQAIDTAITAQRLIRK